MIIGTGRGEKLQTARKPGHDLAIVRGVAAGDHLDPLPAQLLELAEHTA